MIPVPDRTLRYSPRDLLAYLEGDAEQQAPR